MRYYMIAGEASGDLHASNLMRELKNRDHRADFRCWGGDLMEKQGGQLVRHYRDLAFMGFLEVVGNFGTILRNIRFCKKDILRYNPDVLILVDYPGFNLRIAAFAKEHGIRVFYYISPQLWAWRPSRVRIIRKSVERMFVILPFEKDFYSRYGFEVDYVGHPLLDVIDDTLRQTDPQAFFRKNGLDERPVIALLPGSRLQEVRIMLRTMVRLALFYPGHQFVIAGAPSLPKETYEAMVSGSGISVVFNQTYDLLRNAAAALVTSGTATLETALMRVPQVVCYKGSAFSYLIARQVVKVSFISLVNLIYGKELVKELIQGGYTLENLRKNLDTILYDDHSRQTMLSGYGLLEEKLGGAGASARTAALMIQYLEKK